MAAIDILLLSFFAKIVYATLRSYPYSYSLATDQLKSVAIHILLISFLVVFEVMHVSFV